LNGWCAGDGAAVPLANAFLLPKCEEDIGEMLCRLDEEIAALIEWHKPDLVIFEAPILPSGGNRKGQTVMGKTIVRRKLMNLSGHVEFMCKTRKIECKEVEVRQIKRELAGFAQAEKSDMVVAALRAGIDLPATKAAGQEDAADAFGAWLLGLRYANRALSSRWDSRLYGGRGSLL
jgi:Holliday junction resolvasome RuvABC endonuclease subunit